MGRLIEWEMDEEAAPWLQFPTTLLLVLGFELLEYSLPDPFPLMWRVVCGEIAVHTHLVMPGETCVVHITRHCLLYLGHVWWQLRTYEANVIMVDGGVDSWDHCGSWR